MSGGREPLLLSARDVGKSFGATVALDRFGFDLAPGRVHALVGENGAGKSTFIKILAGLHQPDSGRIEIGGGRDGHPAIAFIHQDLGLIPGMSVADNLLLGSEYPRRAGLIDWRAVHAEARRSLGRIGADIDTEAPIDDLAMAERALVAIARALRQDARILVLDEPTATLPGHDVDTLFDVLRALKRTGIGMIYVSHRLREILSIADEVTVIRDGRLSHHGPAAALTEARLVELMVGTDPATVTGGSARPQAGGSDAAIVLSATRMSAPGLAPTDLSVRAGEIVGCVGLRGAGQEVVGRVLLGMAEASGEIALGGRPFRPRRPAEALARGVSLVSGNREAAVVRAMTVQENLLLNPRFTPAPDWFRRAGAERRAAAQAVRSYDVRPDDPSRPIGELSGGNAQKVVFARGLGSDPILVVLDDPTAGVDMPTRFGLYDLMRARAGQGLAFLLSSSDYDEVAAVCTRIHVFRQGRIAVTLDAPPFDPEQIAVLASEDRASEDRASEDRAAKTRAWENRHEP